MKDNETEMAQSVHHNSKERQKTMPGETGVWILIYGDMMIFGLFFGTYLYYRSLAVDLFDSAQQTLNTGLGLLNTILLLTSSWLVVWALRCAKHGKAGAAVPLLIAAMAMGIGFWIVKIIEYWEKLSTGYTITTNQFFSFYYMFTGIHLVHVTVGLISLGYALLLARRSRTSGSDYRILESIGVFWHMVDLLWIVLFAILYLVK